MRLYLFRSYSAGLHRITSRKERAQMEEMAPIKILTVGFLLFSFVNGNEEQVSSNNKMLLCNVDVYPSKPRDEHTFALEDLNPNFCTHIIYNKASIDNINHAIEPKDPEVDLYEKGGQGMYNRTMKLKEVNPQMKIILQICCLRPQFWENTTLSTSEINSKFIKNAVNYLKLYGFDGLYFNVGRNSDEHQLMADLRTEFNKHGYLLYTFVFPEEVPEVPTGPEYEYTQETTQAFDFLIVGRHWSVDMNKTTIFSSIPSLNSALTELMSRGIPREKLVVGIPTFTVSYKLCNDSDNGISADICLLGEEHEGPAVILEYSDIVRMIGNVSEGWVMTRDEETGMMYGHSKSSFWTSYEDPVSVRAKVQYAIEENYAGVAIMTVDMDDYIGLNEDGTKLPLLKAAYDALNGN